MYKAESKGRKIKKLCINWNKAKSKGRKIKKFKNNVVIETMYKAESKGRKIQKTTAL